MRGESVSGEMVRREISNLTKNLACPSLAG